MAADNGLRPLKPLDVASLGLSECEYWRQNYNWYAYAVQLNKKKTVGSASRPIRYRDRVRRTEDLQDVRAGPGGERESRSGKGEVQRTIHAEEQAAYERYKFNKMKQQEGETVKNVLTTPGLQADECRLRNLTNDFLRDRIIVGISNDYVR